MSIMTAHCKFVSSFLLAIETMLHKTWQLPFDPKAEQPYNTTTLDYGAELLGMHREREDNDDVNVPILQMHLLLFSFF